MTIITLLIALAVWNWLGGLVLGIVLGAIIVAPVLFRFKNDPENIEKARAYFCAVATNHLLNHLGTVIGSGLLCAASAADGNVPPWMAWTIFGVYVVFWRLFHILDSIGKMISGAGMPDGSYM